MPIPLDFAAQTAQAAGKLLLDSFRLEGTAANRKADRTFVTAADLAADRIISEAIHSAYPDDLILSEEAATDAPAKGRPVWVIDPLDGTTNFSLGLHTWGVSIARLVDGQPDTAALSFPLLNEHYTAQRGAGATLNGKALDLTIPPINPSTSFFACCSRTLQQYEVNLKYKTRILGSAAYNFCAVARGAALAGFQATPKLWDIAAGWLVLIEAGGTCEVLSGPSPFPIQDEQDYSQVIFPSLMAANQAVANYVRTNIQKRQV